MTAEIVARGNLAALEQMDPAIREEAVTRYLEQPSPRSEGDPAVNVEATNESALTTIVRVLSETYTDAGVLIWLNAKNKQLRSKPDGSWSCSPAEYIAAGHADEVLAAARRIEGAR